MAVANNDSRQPSDARSVELRVAATVENLAVLRALVAAVGTFEDLDFDAVADLRLAVDEACTRLIRSAVPGATLMVRVHPHDDVVVVKASTAVTEADILTPGSFSWHVLSSLTDEVRTYEDGQAPTGQAPTGQAPTGQAGVGQHRAGRVAGIAMTTRRASSLR